MIKSFTLALLASASLASIDVHAASAPITWGTPTNETGNVSDVIITGTLVAAVTSGASTTLNGVSFIGGAYGAAFPSVSTLNFGSGVTLTGASASNFSWATVPTSWNPSYQTLVNTGSSGANANNPTLTISGLTVGNTYLLQIFEPTSVGNVFGPWPTTFSAGGKTSSAVTNSAPQYITGTFTANATSEAITLSGSNGYGVFAALQLRNTTVAPVPEASASLMMSAGLAALGFLGWRRRRAA